MTLVTGLNDTDVTSQEFSTRSFGSVLTAGAGLSLNYKRFAAFSEYRPLLHGSGIAEHTSGLTFGIRIQPDN